jgi:peptidoglycan/LPS O-acetylase OafA/YrhL
LDNTEHKPKLYFPNLDGLRSIAAFMVIFYHVSIWFPAPQDAMGKAVKRVIGFSEYGGSYGVYFFFVLSGFLITFLLLNERARKGRIHLRHFYLRRVLRIWPLYFATVIVGFFIYPALKSISGESFEENASLLYYATFLTNYDHIFNGMPSSPVLGVQWSVAIEEQFYLLWPLLFLVVSTPVLLSFLVAALFVFSDWYSLTAASWSDSYFNFLSCIRFLAAGGLLAILSFYRMPVIDRLLRAIKGPPASLIYLVSIFVLFFSKEITAAIPAAKYVVHMLPFFFFCFVIVHQCFAVNLKWQMSGMPAMMLMGKISYGLYLTHMIVIVFAMVVLKWTTSAYFYAALILVPVLTVMLSYVSYTYFEAYFLRLKSRYSKV